MAWPPLVPSWRAKDLAKVSVIESDRPAVLRDYGATNEAELFAVVSEVFFERPALLRTRAPERNARTTLSMLKLSPETQAFLYGPDIALWMQTVGPPPQVPPGATAPRGWS